MKKYLIFSFFMFFFLIFPVSAEDYAGICFVGDSRTVGMKIVNSNPSNHFIAQSSTGYEWFSTTAANELRNYLHSHSSVAVVYNFGVNDLGANGEANVYKYISLYKKIQNEFPKVDFYYMTVNPVQNHPYISNSAIEHFNSIVENNFPKQIINTYSNINFQFSDNAHYQVATYREIISYTENQLKDKKGSNVREVYPKPVMTELDPDAKGCKLFGDELLDLLAEIYHWIRGICIAAVVILGVTDFIKAFVVNNDEAVKKAGVTFFRKLILLAILIILPDLIDFILQLIFGQTTAGNCLEKF